MTDRRDFLKTLAGLTTGLMLPYHALAAPGVYESDKWGRLLPRRVLGRTGTPVTMLALGGNHIGNMSEYEAQKAIEVAMEGGIRLFETAASYQRGGSERLYGKYLVPSYRNEVFIVSKSRATDAETARRELRESLERMNLDYIDLWKVHAVRTPEDFDNRMSNGVIEVFEEALESGKVKYIGLSGHTQARAFQHLLRRKDIFHSVQMAINPVDAASENSFIKDVMPVLVEKNIGILAMKTLANGRFFGQKESVRWSTDRPVIPAQMSIRDVYYYVWSLPVSSLVSGADTIDMLREKIEFARDFVSLSEEERQTLVSRVQSYADGSVEYYKG